MPYTLIDFKFAVLLLIGLFGIAKWSAGQNITIAQSSNNSASTFNTIKTFKAAEAHQGVAVDANHFYAIGTRSIGKYNKETGEKSASWEEEADGPVKHLDSGVVIDGKLYAAHSNYPEIPMTSSVEVWDTQTLKHLDSYSFGIRWGSLTWIDWHNGRWWGVFANYQKFAKQTGRDNSWTTLVKFTDNWEPLQSWILPPNVLKRIHPMSNSGGSWGPDGMLYLSGHNRAELYKMTIPQAGSELILEQIIPIESHGQGIAWDRYRSQKNNVLYSIQRDKKQVLISVLE